MKKTISLMLCLLMIFSSVSFAFAADWSTTDQNNLQSIKNAVNLGGGLYTLVSNANQNLISACSLINTANGYLSSLVSDGGTDYTQLLTDILNSQTYFTSGGNARNSWLQKLDNDLLNIYNYVNTISTVISSYLPSIKNDTGTYLPYLDVLHKNGLESYGSALTYPDYGNNGIYNNTTMNFSGQTNPFTTLLLTSRLDQLNRAKQYQYLLANYNTEQQFTNWRTLQTNTFTPSSLSNGLYNWLSNIQKPIARLAYVHASDEEISAREKAEANQTAVVNNFIDSSGSGAAPASSFSDIASMSTGYTSNMDTDANPSGIWNIFNSNNFGWFSQETANQLDTTVSTRKGSSDFYTPLLDQKIAEIYKELGVNVND